MARILILFAHPVLEKSRVHHRLIKQLAHKEHVTFHDLYELYPDFDIDVQKEQQLLLQHDIIILQHPFYWYSAPAILKQWMDLVLEHGWAYGTGGKMLAGKRIFNVITCGGPRESYAHGARNRFTIRNLLAPFEQTAFLCNMTYMPPYVIHGTHRLSINEIEEKAKEFEHLMSSLHDKTLMEVDWQQYEYLNDWHLIA